ncbi:heat shock 70 kDa protein 12A-like [Mercenaria mercenaria]|uniref:heat shock 70 kDa protein 12A-like n=1 Tax=Mercenaria mercenaria TaxID=6596 RepID=UPI00234ED484|nr:heat shock 70 kDa protein 12A-like [Mercenaria mercenaria]XP_053374855.1 heat shock 70 kDa protein 12A-like [Mercenaria mercenaria]
MDPLVVVAIDFGTTYSGWAFSFRHEYERDPIKVSSKIWQGGTLVSQKGPTCILIKSDGKTTDSFGYDAESKYAEKVEENEQDQWFFFKRFKMLLFKDKGMKRNATLEDESGKKLPAMTVFSLSIEYLKKNALDTLNKQVDTRLDVDDIHWVLTVPAIWNDAAKQFMREAAQKVGISGKKLRICLEPEAASIYCRHLPVSKSSAKGEKSSFAQFSTGTKYLVLDAGGGTVDITVHEVTTSGELKELHKASGGAWGGTKVDQAYEEFLTSFVGSEVIMKFKNKHMDDYIEVFRDFEIKKRQISPTNQVKVTIRMPASLSTLCSEMRSSDLKSLILQSRFGGKVKVLSDKLRIDADVVREFFRPTVRNIIDHVATLLKEPSVHGCAAILMVGGFSASPMLQENVQATFPELRIIVPDDAGLAVLKGAVIFGHEPTAISERVCKYTYGTNTSHRQTSRCKHPQGRVEKDKNGDLRCYDIFRIHAKAGQSVKLHEEQQEQIYTPVTDNQTVIGFKIYSSSATCPYLITEKGCNLIGELAIPISDKSLGRKHEFGTSFIFGGTEIVVKVVDKVTSDVTYESVDFLG